MAIAACCSRRAVGEGSAGDALQEYPAVHDWQMMSQGRVRSKVTRALTSVRGIGWLHRVENEKVCVARKIEELQRQVCDEHKSAFTPVPDQEKAGFALSTRHMLPLNGLRHRPESGTTSWYIWGGTELSGAPDFFTPLCVAISWRSCRKPRGFWGSRRASDF